MVKKHAIFYTATESPSLIDLLSQHEVISLWLITV